MLSKDAINEYKQIYQDEYGVSISDKEAAEKALNFLKVFKLIYQPVSKNWIKERVDKRV